MMIEQFRIKFPKIKAHDLDQDEEYFFRGIYLTDVPVMH